MNQAVITYGGFATKHNVTLTYEEVDSRPDDDGQWGREASHWRVKVKRGRKSMIVYYSKGIAHEGESPTISELLCCLAIDASTTDNSESFEDWASEFGYDTDSHQAEKSYKSCVKQTTDLKRVLGDDLYTALLNAEEDDE